MELIIGGAYQGKLEYALKHYGLTGADVFDCRDFSFEGGAKPDFSKKILYHFEAYVLACMRAGVSPLEWLPEEAIVISDDIFCGVVPIDTEIRAWREECGRTLTAIAARSSSVTRIFCGLPARIK
ncbi:MAG: bifunctional adenosylcobinamide kinase/adenosylcobinamide-phosphate guanylyltransferase [Oscillospiraceae bacterium]|nr:bifunctional adenosylcobinamide kinase/adenosylcobinamide-phosphate guanylyltransferase [Lachnospiraceae bacterium]MBR0391844.1 bifunctional adenosylcobinamide kinase/adenosylcobinamide-phosphate guanylyltransferase [Oscillospiraceae bacterium]